MSKSKHTPGPWATYGTANQHIRTEAGLSEFRAYKIGDRVDAARIVACVNAMEGIDDPAAARAVLDDPKVDAMTDMLQALKLAMERHPYYGYQEEGPEPKWHRLARAAIAKAEGRK